MIGTVKYARHSFRSLDGSIIDVRFFSCSPPALVQCINSIYRALLNQVLLDEAVRMPKVKVFFNHKVTALDFDARTMAVKEADTDQDVQVAFDLCVGADGSYSIVRRQLMRVVR